EAGRVILLPVKEKLEQKTVIVSGLLKIAFPMIFCSFVAWYLFSFANNLNYQRLIKNVREQVNQLKPTADKVKDYLGMKTRLEERKQLLDKAKGRQPLWSGVFKELSNVTPQEVIIKKITAVSNKEQKEIHIFGRITAKYTNIDVALSQYVMSLDESPFFSSVEMVSSTKDMYSAVPAANFEIVCKLVY
ncbi:MAG: PilN domain-containing protein, partial [Candidatus Omnitrophica bacterium]|nr:PilN domain-containing protein [Candidatus Omnitrophota bacterium]